MRICVPSPARMVAASTRQVLAHSMSDRLGPLRSPRSSLEISCAGGYHIAGHFDNANSGRRHTECGTCQPTACAGQVIAELAP